MGTGNFYTECGRYFVLNPSAYYVYNDKGEIDYFYQETIKDIENEVINRLSKYDIYEVDKWDNNSRYEGHIFACIDEYFTDSRGNEIKATIKLICRNGYYEGVNFDYSVEIEDFYCSNPKLIERTEKWVNKVCQTIEKVYSELTDEYVATARFSNGETWYSPVKNRAKM